jgi:peptidoglycan/LPS O-acetylase OafA/YrhL
VSFFFMLSGFVLAWARSDNAGDRSFWRNRFARIWPTHMAALLLTLTLPWLVDGTRPVPTLIAPVVFLVQAWIPSRRWFFAPNIVSWSLSCEMFFYLMFPWLRRRIAATRRPVALLVALLVLIWLVPVATTPLSTADRFWAGYVFPLARLPEFCVGIVLCRLVSEGRVRWTSTSIPTLLALAVVISDRWMPARVMYVAWGAVPLAWLLASSAARAVEGRRSVLDLRPFVWLGEVSFAFYLVHAVVFTWTYKTIGILRHGPLSHIRPLLATELVLSVIGAWILHRLVETPLERRLRAPRVGSATTLRVGSDDDRLAQSHERS